VSVSAQTHQYVDDEGQHATKQLTMGRGRTTEGRSGVLARVSASCSCLMGRTHQRDCVTSLNGVFSRLSPIENTNFSRLLHWSNNDRHRGRHVRCVQPAATRAGFTRSSQATGAQNCMAGQSAGQHEQASRCVCHTYTATQTPVCVCGRCRPHPHLCRTLRATAVLRLRR
jgi:hypothetical protein